MIDGIFKISCCERTTQAVHGWLEVLAIFEKGSREKKTFTYL